MTVVQPFWRTLRELLVAVLPIALWVACVIAGLVMLRTWGF
jgi:hypothetical protein